MDVSWRQVMRERVGKGEFAGYEKHIGGKLYRKLPLGVTTFDDVLSEMRMYVIEAIDLYDVDRGAAFETFLYKHLSIRSMQWFNYAWMRKNHPNGKWVYSWSVLAEGAKRKLDTEESFDPTSVSEDNSTWLEIREFLGVLTPPSQRILKMLLPLADSNLIAAFKSPYYRMRVSQMTGLGYDEVEVFVRECREKLPKYLSSISGV